MIPPGAGGKGWVILVPPRRKCVGSSSISHDPPASVFVDINMLDLPGPSELARDELADTEVIDNTRVSIGRKHRPGSPPQKLPAHPTIAREALADSVGAEETRVLRV